MLKKLREFIGGAKRSPTLAVTKPVVLPAPSAPLEILVPDEARLHEAPRLAGRMMSFLVAADQDVTSFEYFEKEERVGSNNNDLKQFLLTVAGARQLPNLISQCTAVMYPPKCEGSFGDLACIQQGNLHSFAVFALSESPNLKWEIHRKVRSVEVEPYGPNNAFKPTPNGAA